MPSIGEHCESERLGTKWLSYRVDSRFVRKLTIGINHSRFTEFFSNPRVYSSHLAFMDQWKEIDYYESYKRRQLVEDYLSFPFGKIYFDSRRSCEGYSWLLTAAAILKA